MTGFDPGRGGEPGDAGQYSGFDPAFRPDPAGGERPAGAEDGEVAKTGTTTVGLTVEDGVVIVTDRRASLGGRFVSNKHVQKVEQVHPTAALTLVGSVGGAQSFIRTLRAESNLYGTRRDEPMSISALATMAGNLARGGPYFAISPVLGGVDDEGPHVFSIDPAGGVMEDEYTVSGSAMQLAYGVLEGEYDDSLSMDDAVDLGVRAVEAASARDTASGDGFVVARVTGEGVDIEHFDDVETATAE